MNPEIWDLHCHLTGMPGQTPEERIDRLLGYANRILFGSHSPLFYFESASLKLKESPLTPEQLKRIRSDNARQLITRV